MKYVLLASILMTGCVTKQLVHEALTVSQITCALLNQSTDVEEVRLACGIEAVLRPYLERLLTGKAAAQKAALARDGGV